MGVKEIIANVGNVLTGGLVEKAVGIVDKMVTDKDLAQKLKAEMETLRQVQAHQLELAQVDMEKALQIEHQKTIQAELAQSDVYTKQTRPKIARQSWYVSGVYAIGCLVSKLVPQIPDVLFEPELYLAAAAPALTYIGVRSFDIWRRGGAKLV